MSRTRNARAFTALLLLTSLILPTAPASATCGGGGGGGMGGAMSGHSSEEVYHVPWKVVAGTAPVPAGDLGVYWFPKSPAEVNTSRLRLSRTLTLVSERCVAEADFVAVVEDAVDLRRRIAHRRIVAILKVGSAA